MIKYRHCKKIVKKGSIDWQHRLPNKNPIKLK